MSVVLGVVGAVTPPGRLHTAVSWLMEDIAATGQSTELLNLAELKISFADGRDPGSFADDTERAVAAFARASAVVFAAPVYRASIPGSLKNLLDHVPVEALMGKTCAIVAMGATAHHFLAVDGHLRDILNWFGAILCPTSVYLLPSDFATNGLSDTAKARLQSLAMTVRKLDSAIGPIQADLGPPPLARVGR